MRVPGAPERRPRETRLADGVPLADDARQAIVGAAREVNVDRRSGDAAL